MEAGFQREDENVDDGGNHKRPRQVRNVKNPITCEIDFDGTLTPEAYSKLVSETIKYVLYSRGQLPLQCDLLFKLYLQDDKQDGAVGDQSSSNAVRLKSQFRKVKQTVENIKDLLEQIDYLFCKNETFEIQEFLIVIGATPVSPKNTFNIKLPDCTNASVGVACPIRRCLVQMFRKLVMMEELSGIPSVGLTNTYFFVKMRRTVSSDMWFLPKPDFKPLTSRGLWIVFIFKAAEQTIIQSGINEAGDQEMTSATMPVQTTAFQIFSEPPAVQSKNDERYLSAAVNEHVPCMEQAGASANSVSNLTSGVKQLNLVDDPLDPLLNEDEEQFIWFQAPIVIKGVTGATTETSDWM